MYLANNQHMFDAAEVVGARAVLCILGQVDDSSVAPTYVGRPCLAGDGLPDRPVARPLTEPRESVHMLRPQCGHRPAALRIVESARATA